MSEAKFNLWLRSQIPGDMMRVESTVGYGTPDINVCYEGVEIWIESKVLTSGMALLRKEQHAWGFRRARSGGRAWVLVDHGEAVACHRHPVEVRPMGKYLEITSNPTYTWHRKDFRHYAYILFE